MRVSGMAEELKLVQKSSDLLLLKKADEQLFKLRLLVRLSHSMKFINTGSYEFAAKSLDEIGRMLGGLIKRQPAG